MLRRGEKVGGTGEVKRVSIAEDRINTVDLRRLQEDILNQIRNRAAFPLRKVSTSRKYLQEDCVEGEFERNFVHIRVWASIFC